jgi:hypothetical protein
LIQVVRSDDRWRVGFYAWVGTSRLRRVPSALRPATMSWRWQKWLRQMFRFLRRSNLFERLLLHNMIFGDFRVVGLQDRSHILVGGLCVLVDWLMLPVPAPHPFHLVEAKQGAVCVRNKQTRSGPVLKQEWVRYSNLNQGICAPALVVSC